MINKYVSVLSFNFTCVSVCGDANLCQINNTNL